MSSLQLLAKLFVVECALVASVFLSHKAPSPPTHSRSKASAPPGQVPTGKKFVIVLRGQSFRYRDDTMDKARLACQDFAVDSQLSCSQSLVDKVIKPLEAHGNQVKILITDSIEEPVPTLSLSGQPLTENNHGISSSGFDYPENTAVSNMLSEKPTNLLQKLLWFSPLKTAVRLVKDKINMSHHEQSLLETGHGNIWAKQGQHEKDFFAEYMVISRKDQDLKDSLRENGGPLPTRPGCYIYMPSGCEKRKFHANVWRKDPNMHMGAESNFTACMRRREQYNSWCDKVDSQIHWVSKEEQQEARPVLAQKDKDLEESAWGNGGPLPTRPGCYIYMPSGCEKRKFHANVWRLDPDRHKGAHSNQTACMLRKEQYNNWCDKLDSQIHWVSATEQQDAHPALTFTAPVVAAKPFETPKIADDRPQTFTMLCADVWEAMADGKTCGAHVTLLTDTTGINRSAAMHRVAEQYPEQCGACAHDAEAILKVEPRAVEVNKLATSNSPNEVSGEGALRNEGSYQMLSADAVSAAFHMDNDGIRQHEKASLTPPGACHLTPLIEHTFNANSSYTRVVGTKYMESTGQPWNIKNAVNFLKETYGGIEGVQKEFDYVMVIRHDLRWVQDASLWQASFDNFNFFSRCEIPAPRTVGGNNCVWDTIHLMPSNLFGIFDSTLGAEKCFADYDVNDHNRFVGHGHGCYEPMQNALRTADEDFKIGFLTNQRHRVRGTTGVVDLVLPIFK